MRKANMINKIRRKCIINLTTYIKFNFDIFPILNDYLSLSFLISKFHNDYIVLSKNYLSQ